MIWGIDNKGERIEATPKKRAICPICGSELISKCGKILVWHWAHINMEECDNWSEGETWWHLDWKNKFPKENQEVIIGKHIADVRTPSRWVIELQNSPISSEEIIEREEYYKRMVWLLNGETLGKNIELNKEKRNGFTFRWKHPPKSWWFCEKDIFVDLSENLEEMYKEKFDIEKGKYVTKQVSSEDYNEYSGNSYWTSSYIDITQDYLKKLKRNIKLLEKKPILKIITLYKKTPCFGFGKLFSIEEFIKIYN